MSLDSFGDHSDQKMVSKQLHGPRPSPLMVNKKNNSSKILKKKKKPFLKRCRSPVIVYIRSPKTIHVSPHEFMSVVQQLTGNHDHQRPIVVAPSGSSSSASSTRLMEVDEITSKRDLGLVSSEMGSMNPSSFAAAPSAGLSADISADIQKFGGTL